MSELQWSPVARWLALLNIHILFQPLPRAMYVHVRSRSCSCNAMPVASAMRRWMIMPCYVNAPQCHAHAMPCSPSHSNQRSPLTITLEPALTAHQRSPLTSAHRSPALTAHQRSPLTSAHRSRLMTVDCWRIWRSESLLTADSLYSLLTVAQLPSSSCHHRHCSR